jgi:hypothetical protein
LRRYQEILSLTKLTYAIIVEDMKELIHQTDKEQGWDSNYAFLSGVQIHSPYGHDFIWPGTLFVRVEGKIERFSLI